MVKSSKKKSDKTENLVDRPKTELLNLLKKVQEEWWKLKIDLRIGKLKDVHAPRKKRKEIARIKTIIRNKEIS